MLHDRLRALRHLLIIAAIASITACSFKSVYNKLDYLIPEYVEGMVTLDDPLEEQVEQRSAALINWHRRTQLPEYSEWLQGLQREVLDDLTVEQVQRRFDDGNQFWLSMLSRINQEMAVLLPQLDENERNELFASIAEKNDDYRKKYIDICKAEMLDGFYEQLIEFYETWLGTITEQQRKYIELTALELESSALYRLQRRQEWQQGIRLILESASTQSEKEQALLAFFNNFENNQNNNIQRSFEVNRKLIAELTVKIAHSLTPDQKNYFTQKTNDYIRMFNELVNEG